VPN
jgi:hypothetical protein